ncbi:unnamed protein product [Protopolystoma xenopodis]|uniref:Uncharacterized protein n=1 Tax=Protopolystoma xenopodis TaxID=117903 RepID=A0A448WKM3_9PLAT|nr:unnamed protein product [Protopolystoma xenopodis]
MFILLTVDLNNHFTPSFHALSDPHHPGSSFPLVTIFTIPPTGKTDREPVCLGNPYLTTISKTGGLSFMLEPRSIQSRRGTGPTCRISPPAQVLALSSPAMEGGVALHTFYGAIYATMNMVNELRFVVSTPSSTSVDESRHHFL